MGCCAAKEDKEKDRARKETDAEKPMNPLDQLGAPEAKPDPAVAALQQQVSELTKMLAAQQEAKKEEALAKALPGPEPHSTTETPVASNLLSAPLSGGYNPPEIEKLDAGNGSSEDGQPKLANSTSNLNANSMLTTPRRHRSSVSSTASSARVGARRNSRKQPPPPPPGSPPEDSPSSVSPANKAPIVLMGSENQIKSSMSSEVQKVAEGANDAEFKYTEKPYEMGLFNPDAACKDRIRTLLLIGETGSGKSTLINAMANYCAGVEFSDDVRYRLVHEPAKDQAYSQTQSVSSYHVWCKKYSFTLRLIDTPGFGDTSGVERDESITKDIYSFLQKEEEIHGVCFVAAASLPRLTVTQQYIINKVLTMFGTDAISNVFLLVTFADGKKAQVLNAIKASGFPYREECCFHFNNSALYASGEERNEYSRNFWGMGTASLEKFFSMLGTKDPFNLTKTKDVIATQKKLQNYVASITPQVTIGLSKIDNLKGILDDIKVNREKIDENKDYSYQETIPKVERMLKKPGTYNTQCLRCSYNCHHDCTRSNDEDKQYCCAMDTTGHCTVCVGKCHWTEHANLDYYFEWSTQIVARQYDTKKLQLSNAKDGLSRSEALKTSILEELQTVYDTVHNLMTSIHEAHAKLDEIALRPTNLQFADYLKLLIEQEKLHKRPGFDGRIQQLHIMLEQAKIRQDIVEKKYDPISEWKNNVEKELQSLGGWEEPVVKDPVVERPDDGSTDGPDDSDTDTDTDSTIEIEWPTDNQVQGYAVAPSVVNPPEARIISTHSKTTPPPNVPPFQHPSTTSSLRHPPRRRPSNNNNFSEQRASVIPSHGSAYSVGTGGTPSTASHSRHQAPPPQVWPHPSDSPGMWQPALGAASPSSSGFTSGSTPRAHGYSQPQQTPGYDQWDGKL